jgi:HEAT repeat protein
MKPVQDLSALEQHMKSGSEQQRIDALFKTLAYGKAGLYLIIQALDDPSQPVRETANLLLSEYQSARAKQALWDYLSDD